MHRSNLFIAALALWTLVFMSSVGAADIYRWDDADGNRHLVNDIADVPADFREAALADHEKRSQKQGVVNVIGAGAGPGAKGASASPHTSAPPAAMGSARSSMTPMPGGQPEVWWQQNAMRLDRNLSAAQSALETARASQEDDSVSVYGPGRAARHARPGGLADARRHRAPRVADDGSNDYTDYSEESDIDAYEAAVEDAERAKQDFHGQARRASVPAGWLRR